MPTDERIRIGTGERALAAVAPGEAAPEPSRAAWTRFWFTPMVPAPLHVIRLLSGLLFICWLLPFAGHVVDFFSIDGWFNAYFEVGRVQEELPVPLGWSVLYLCGSNTTLLHVMYWSAIGIFLLFALGVATRVTGVLTWVMVVSFTANPASSYDADFLLVILAFYLMLAYLLLGQWSRPLTAWQRLLGSADDLLWKRSDERPPSHAANMVLRLIQVHFAVIVVVSGLHKLQFAEWWAGVAYWFPLHSPFTTTQEMLQRRIGMADSYLFLISLGQYLMLVWQLGFPMFAWRRGWGWRLLLLGGAAVGWWGALAIYGLPLFGPIYCIACLSFLTPAEWQRLRGLVTSRMTGFAPPKKSFSAADKLQMAKKG